MKITWILGWAVPEAWFAPVARSVFPAAEHACVPATPRWRDALGAAGPADWIVGYSLGAHLLLSAGSISSAQIALLAPFLGFPAEAGQGGRVAAAQVKYLARWLQRDRPAALADFYHRANLPISAAPGAADAAGAIATADLLWGLELLAQTTPAPRQLLVDVTNWPAFCGSNDPLIDGMNLRASLPQLEIIPGAGHEPRPLLEALAARIA